VIKLISEPDFRWGIRPDDTRFADMTGTCSRAPKKRRPSTETDLPC
jgi:hypothetical protein